MARLPVAAHQWINAARASLGTDRVAAPNPALQSSAPRRTTSKILAAFDSVPMDFAGSERSWGYGGGRDLSRLPLRAYPDPDLEDGTVRLRRWAHTDLDCVRQAAGDPRIPERTTVPAVFTAEAGHAFIERQRGRIEKGEGVSLAVADAGTDEALGLGVLLVRPQTGVVGIGYWVVPRARGRGVATRAVCLLSRWVLSNADTARVEAWVEPENVASQRVLSAAGFAREGVLRSLLSYAGRRSDAVVYSRTGEDAVASAG